MSSLGYKDALKITTALVAIVCIFASFCILDTSLSSGLDDPTVLDVRNDVIQPADSALSVSPSIGKNVVNIFPDRVRAISRARMSNLLMKKYSRKNSTVKTIWPDFNTEKEVDNVIRELESKNEALESKHLKLEAKAKFVASFISDKVYSATLV